nr:TonB-dependent receptor [uncultured Caulobacter sp.]
MRKADTTLNIPLSSIAAARVTGFYADQDPLIGNAVSGGFSRFGRREYGARAKLLIEPVTAWSIYLGADFADSDGMETGNFTPRSEGPALAGLHAAASVRPSPTNLWQSGDAPSDLHYQIGGAQANVSFTFGNGATLTNIVGYRSYRANHTIDLDLAQIDLLNGAAARFKFDQITNELRVASPEGQALTYQAGLFYYQGFDRRQDQLRGNIALGAPPPGKQDWLGLDAQDDLHSKSWAAYAQASQQVTDRLKLTAGGRLTRDEVRFNGGYSDAAVAITIAGGGPGAQSFRDRQTHTDFSWRTSADYALARDVNVYVTVARGYKGPGYNLSWAGSPGAAPVGAETSMDYELGLRSILFGRLVFNATAYLENFDDFQVQSFKATGVPGVGSFIIQNAGSLRARGVEANVSLRVDQRFSLSGSLAYNDAIYRRFPGAPCYVGQTAAQGCVGGAVDASGHRLVNAPKWTGTLAADYRYPLTSGWTALMSSSPISWAIRPPQTRACRSTTISRAPISAIAGTHGPTRKPCSRSGSDWPTPPSPPRGWRRMEPARALRSPIPGHGPAPRSASSIFYPGTERSSNGSSPSSGLSSRRANLARSASGWIPVFWPIGMETAGLSRKGGTLSHLAKTPSNWVLRSRCRSSPANGARGSHLCKALRPTNAGLKALAAHKL